MELTEEQYKKLRSGGATLEHSAKVTNGSPYPPALNPLFSLICSRKCAQIFVMVSYDATLRARFSLGLTSPFAIIWWPCAGKPLLLCGTAAVECDHGFSFRSLSAKKIRQSRHLCFSGCSFLTVVRLLDPHSGQPARFTKSKAQSSRRPAN